MEELWELLKVFGGIFIVLAMVFAGIVLFLYFRFRKMLRSYPIDSLQPPFEIELKPAPKGWADEETTGRYRKELAALGFTEGNAYYIEEFQEVLLMSFFAPDHSVMAVLYFHPEVGAWVDFAAEMDDGTEIMVSNTPIGREIDTRPECVNIIDTENSLPEMAAEIRKRIAGKTAVPIAKTDFRTRFESAYRKDMEWRNRRGGISREEVERIAQKKGIQVADMDYAFDELKRNELLQWHHGCLQTFITETEMPVSEWVKYEDNLFIISDRVDPKYLVEYLEDFMNHTQARWKRFREMQTDERRTGELFDEINEALHEDERARKIGSVNFPIEADIYYAPLPEDE